jgi:hypothetical protein
LTRQTANAASAWSRDRNQTESNPIKPVETAWKNQKGAFGLERGCVQSTSRSTWKSSAASGVFQQAGFAKLLRLVPLCGTQPRPVVEGGHYRSLTVAIDFTGAHRAPLQIISP